MNSSRADAGAERRDQRRDLAASQHLVEARALDVEDLAAQGQHRLVGAVARLLGGAAGGIAFDDEDLAFRRIALLAIGELAGQRIAVERALAPGELARLARGLARGGGFDHLADDVARFGRMLLEPAAQLLQHDAFDRRGALREETSLSLVCDENFGSGTLTESTQVRPSRQSSPVSGTRSFLPSPVSSAYFVTTRVSAARNPARCVPPSRWPILLVKHSMFS